MTKKTKLIGKLVTFNSRFLKPKTLTSVGMMNSETRKSPIAMFTIRKLKVLFILLRVATMYITHALPKKPNTKITT